MFLLKEKAIMKRKIALLAETGCVITSHGGAKAFGVVGFCRE